MRVASVRSSNRFPHVRQVDRDRAHAHVTVKNVPAFVGSLQIAVTGEFGRGRY
jgi:hypothetical protein